MVSSPFEFNHSLFNIVSIIVPVGFVIVLGLILIHVFRGLLQWNRNNQSPVQTMEATMVTKRINVIHHSEVGTHHTSTSTHHYATFEADDGSRMEFGIRGRDYGVLVEGDRGRLTFQGTRFKGFERIY